LGDFEAMYCDIPELLDGEVICTPDSRNRSPQKHVGDEGLRVPIPTPENSATGDDGAGAAITAARALQEEVCCADPPSRCKRPVLPSHNCARHTIAPSILRVPSRVFSYLAY